MVLEEKEHTGADVVREGVGQDDRLSDDTTVGTLVNIDKDAVHLV